VFILRSKRCLILFHDLEAQRALAVGLVGHFLVKIVDNLGLPSDSTRSTTITTMYDNNNNNTKQHNHNHNQTSKQNAPIGDPTPCRARRR
jgi:hypothetical protein